MRLVAKAEPEAIIYESTAIPPELNFRKFDQIFGPTNTLRTSGLDTCSAPRRPRRAYRGSSRRATRAGRTPAPAAR